MGIWAVMRILGGDGVGSGVAHRGPGRRRGLPGGLPATSRLLPAPAPPWRPGGPAGPGDTGGVPGGSHRLSRTRFRHRPGPRRKRRGDPGPGGGTGGGAKPNGNGNGKRKGKENGNGKGKGRAAPPSWACPCVPPPRLFPPVPCQRRPNLPGSRPLWWPLVSRVSDSPEIPN